jgi:ATP/ADP translocase
MVTTAGAETLPFLASCVVLPASLAFFMLYNKLVEALPSVSGSASDDGIGFG